MTLLFEFTPDELNSTEQFCKAPFDVIDGEWCFLLINFRKHFYHEFLKYFIVDCVLGAYVSFDINPKVLLSLVG